MDDVSTELPIEHEPPAPLSTDELEDLAELDDEDRARALFRRDVARRAAELGHEHVQVFSSRRGRWRFRCSCMAKQSESWWAVKAVAVEAAMQHLEHAVVDGERRRRASGVSVQGTVGSTR